MTLSLTVGSSSAEIIDNLSDIFDFHLMDPDGWEFLHDEYQVIPKINAIEETLINIIKDNKLDEGQAYVLLNEFHKNLVVFADWILDQDIDLFPCAAIFAGCVAGEDCAPETLKALDEFFDKLENKFNEYRENDALLSTKFEAYYCAARMLGIKSRFSQRLFNEVDLALRNFVEPSYYIEAVVEAARFADNHTSGESLLRLNLESAIAEIHESNFDEDATETSITDNLTGIIGFTSGLASGLPENSSLVEPVLAHFSKAWDALLTMDPKMAWAILAHHVKEAEKKVIPNQRFAAFVHEKAESLKKPKTAKEQAPEKAAMPARPVGPVAKRLMATTYLTPLHPPVAPGS